MQHSVCAVRSRLWIRLWVKTKMTQKRSNAYDDPRRRHRFSFSLFLSFFLPLFASDFYLRIFFVFIFYSSVPLLLLLPSRRRRHHTFRCLRDRKNARVRDLFLMVCHIDVAERDGTLFKCCVSIYHRMRTDSWAFTRNMNQFSGT